MAPAPDPPVPTSLKNVLVKFVLEIIKENIGNDELYDFGIKFFTEAKKKRKKARESWWLYGKLSAVEDQIEYDLDDDESIPLHDSPSSEEEHPFPDVQNPGALKQRRQSVRAEVYDPAKAQAITVPSYPKTNEEVERLMRMAPKIFVLRALDHDALRKVIDALKRVDVFEKQDIITQGDEVANDFYIVDRGVFEAFVTNQSGGKRRVQVYNNEGAFGELALMYNQPRAATVTAMTDGRLWALDRQTFRVLVLNTAFQKREGYMKMLAQVDLFQELKNYERQKLADALMPRVYKKGQKIISQGDQADGMYFVESGEVVLKKMVDGETKELGRTGPGGYFGERALITNQPRAATVFASGTHYETKLAFLDKEAFERLLGPCIDIMKRNEARYQKQVDDLFGPAHSVHRS
ncbi:cAMP-dependent protein kinase type II regulatory subunit-like isoform X2 [Paramacrobiotus metropolitanus]|uniref:cAMP-dependent protein kinase type II regulatory subunit-like isoform X2 n=1 Tax=Paramacrobiotus metropolitanus TaxID=2943436 RepID=UPI002445DF28|nr:cAMP-dependent protein kinase type II regulatory subunit-like isoform X2 [Paramacrobiotus metropolitanus]